jgi:3-hydroxyisobutyrate dehydrogenase
MNLGYIGLGDMGGALATRLVSRHPLHVYDTSEAAVAAMTGKGATPCFSVADLANRCSTVLLCLPTSKHVRSVVFGSGGLADSLRPGSLIIDQTSGDPNITRSMAEELATRSLALVDAPVSGGAPAALEGTISVMLGAREEDLSTSLEVLGLLSNNVTHIGPVGTGHTIKLVNNLLSCTQRLLSLEALALATKNGIDPAKAVDVLSLGGGRNAYLELQGRRILIGDRNRGFSLALAHKDLKLACDLATEVGSTSFYGSLSRDLYQIAMSQLGGDAHVETIADFVERVEEVELRTS